MNAAFPLSLTTKSKLFFSKLFSTHTGNNPQPKPTLISFYFSILHSSPTFIHLRHLHGRLLQTSLYSNVILSSKLILMYSRHNKLVPHSLSVFLHMPNRNVYSWNIIIGEYSRSSSPEMSLRLFTLMLRESNFRPDDFTLPLVLRACACSSVHARTGLSLHGLCVKFGLEVSLFVASGLVFMYVGVGRIFDARALFDEMPKRDSVLWTTMLAGYTQHGEPLLGFQIFRDMIEFRVELDWVVMLSLVLLCAQMGWLNHGKAVHGWCIRKYLKFDLNSGNAIVDMYVKCGALTHAHNLFDKMPARGVISWSSLISGYGLSGNVNMALELFDDMLENRVKPNRVTFLGVLSACAHGGLVEKARWYFKTMQDYNVVAELKHCAALVDCLARAGLLEEAERFVKEMGVEPDEAVLGAILSGCRVHGNVEVGERIASELISLEPEKAGYYVLSANMYAAAGKYKEAEKMRELMTNKDVSKLPGCSSCHLMS